MFYFFEFVTFAFPKAGVLVGSVPITVATLLFLLALLFSIKGIGFMVDRYKGFVIGYAVYAFFVLMPLLLNITATDIGNITIALVMLASPLAILIGTQADFEKTVKIIAVSLIIVGLYAVVQYFFGVERTAIPGVNIAYGDSFSKKTIGYGMSSQGLDALKMPSTYQNGNGAGLFYIMCLPLLFFWKAKSTCFRIIRIVAILAAVAGVMLSGSRTILIPFVVIAIPSLLIYIKRKLPERVQTLYLGGLILVLIGLVLYVFIADSQFIQYFIDRYIVQTLSDPTASGRTAQFGDVLSMIYSLNAPDFLRFFFFGMPWSEARMSEGVLYMLSYYGFLSFLSFLFLLLYPVVFVFKRNKILSVGLILVFIAFLVDRSFNYPPYLINYFFLSGLYMRHTDIISKRGCSPAIG